MTPPAIQSLSSADRDFDAIIEHYINEANFDVAVRFVQALDAAYAVLTQAPDAGAPVLGAAIGLPGLRTWKLRSFPYLICYTHTNAVVIWRILHAQRDLASALAETAFPN